MSEINRNQLIKYKNEIKYCSLVDFGNVIENIIDDCHFIVEEHKRKPMHEFTGLQRLALSILLMNHCNFRVGNLKHNKKSTGLLTIETDQYAPETNSISFLGKKRVLNECYLLDDNLNRQIFELWQEVDNYPANLNNKKYLFRFGGGNHRVNSDDLNDFLKIYNKEFSAKMFRTWKANLLFLDELLKLEFPNNNSQLSQNINNSIKNVAKQLYHTTNICRRSYLDNRIINIYRLQPELFHYNQMDSKELLISLFKRFC